jgi:hypothetical protein
LNRTRLEHDTKNGDYFSVVFMFAFVLKERDCSLHRPERAGPLLTKRTRLCPRRRAAEHQQLSDGSAKDVTPAGAMLRGATRDAGADGMNTTEYFIVDAIEVARQYQYEWHLVRINGYFSG